MESAENIVVFEILIPRTHGRTGEVIRTEILDEWALDTARRFGGITTVGVGVFGVWFDNGEPIEDRSNWYKIGVERGDEGALREHAKKAARMFGQKCIYLEISGLAELVYAGE